MRFFLLSAFFVVSAGENITVQGFEKGNVLLPCDCSNRVLTKDFKWQVEKDEKTGVDSKLIFRFKDGTLQFNGNQSHRYETFFHKDSSNCSVLLKNVTPEDQGKYSCRFCSPNYKYLFVNLVVFGTHIFQRRETHPNSRNVYQCVVKLDSYNETNIEWTLDGKCLSNSTTTNISTTYRLDKETHVHYFHSRLEIERNVTTEPKCKVKSPSDFLPQGSNPNTTPDTKLDTTPDPSFRILCKGVPVVFVLGFLLIWYRRATSHSIPSEGDVEKGDFCHTNTNSDELQSENVKVLSSEMRR